MSTHKCSVFRIEEMLPHPNADSLSITKVGGWQVCMQTAAWKVGDLAVYIEPDMVVPTDRPEFAFLAREGETASRIKAKKLRGQMSYGLCVPAPEGSMIGENVMKNWASLVMNLQPLRLLMVSLQKKCQWFLHPSSMLSHWLTTLILFVWARRL